MVGVLSKSVKSPCIVFLLSAVYYNIVQGVTEKFDDVVVAVGSGGTACGLALGNYLTGSKLKYVAK